MKKYCTECGVEKDVREFSLIRNKKYNKAYLKKRCKPCESKYSAAYIKRKRESDPEYRELLKKRNVEFQTDHLEKFKRIKSKYAKTGVKNLNDVYARAFMRTMSSSDITKADIPESAIILTRSIIEAKRKIKEWKTIRQ